MAGGARHLRGVARPRQFRQRRPAAPQLGQLPRRSQMKIWLSLSLGGAQRRSNPHRVSPPGRRLLRYARNDSRGAPSLVLLSAVIALALFAFHMAVAVFPFLLPALHNIATPGSLGPAAFFDPTSPVHLAYRAGSYPLRLRP